MVVVEEKGSASTSGMVLVVVEEKLSPSPSTSGMVDVVVELEVSPSASTSGIVPVVVVKKAEVDEGAAGLVVAADVEDPACLGRRVREGSLGGIRPSRFRRCCFCESSS